MISPELATVITEMGELGPRFAHLHGKLKPLTVKVSTARPQRAVGLMQDATPGLEPLWTPTYERKVRVP